MFNIYSKYLEYFFQKNSKGTAQGIEKSGFIVSEVYKKKCI